MLCAWFTSAACMSAKCSLCAAVAQGILTDRLVLHAANAAAVPAANADDHAAADARPASPAAGTATCSSGTGAAVSRAGNACHHRTYLTLIFSRYAVHGRSIHALQQYAYMTHAFKLVWTMR